jgi:hypothetical protein
VQIKGVDLPIAANVIDELDKPVDPEDTSNDQDSDKGAVFLNPGGGDKEEVESSRTSLRKAL